MAKNRKEIEDRILMEEELGEEEDYEEYARQRDAREGVRRRKERLELDQAAERRGETQKIRESQAQTV